MKKTFLLGIALCVLGTACSTVTIRDQGMQKLSSEPTWEKSEPFFFWGLAGTANVNVEDICNHRNPAQLQTQRTFVDSLLGIITLGIYSPRSAKVWCEGGRT